MTTPKIPSAPTIAGGIIYKNPGSSAIRSKCKYTYYCTSVNDAGESGSSRSVGMSLANEDYAFIEIKTMGIEPVNSFNVYRSDASGVVSTLRFYQNILPDPNSSASFTLFIDHNHRPGNPEYLNCPFPEFGSDFTNGKYCVVSNLQSAVWEPITNPMSYDDAIPHWNYRLTLHPTVVARLRLIRLDKPNDPAAVQSKLWKYGYCTKCNAELSPAMDGHGATTCSKHSRNTP